jgi:hypothetical protein
MHYTEETIEAYVTQKLSASETVLFEKQMASDPALKSEVALQQDVVSSLRNHRHAELKARLNKIDVGTNTYNIGSKIASSVIIASIVGAGLYLYISNNLETNSGNTDNGTVAAVSTDKNVNQKSEVTTNTISVTPEVNNKNISGSNSNSGQNNNVQKNNNQNVATANSANTEIPSELTLPEVTEFNNNNEFSSSSDNNALPNADIVKSTITKVENTSVAIKDNNKKEYTYQFYSNKLFLYGDFNSSTYDIFEFNRNGKKQVYLYINAQYYQLNNNQVEIANLITIKDKSIIGQLETYRKSSR